MRINYVIEKCSQIRVIGIIRIETKTEKKEKEFKKTKKKIKIKIITVIRNIFIGINKACKINKWKKKKRWF